MADLVHIDAIYELHRLGYVRETLVRESKATLEERHAKEREEDDAALMSVVSLRPGASGLKK
jgi:hypothetical protein